MRSRAATQPACDLSTAALNAWFSVLFVLSDRPSVCRWKDEDIFRVTPLNSCKCFQNCNKKNDPQSETMVDGKPFSQNHWSKNKTASSHAVIIVLQGINLTSAPN
jgi:hypothetical protein